MIENWNVYSDFNFFFNYEGKKMDYFRGKFVVYDESFNIFFGIIYIFSRKIFFDFMGFCYGLS